MNARARATVLVVAAACAGGVLAGCAPAVPEVSGIGSGSPKPAVTLPVNPTPQPTPTSWAVDDTSPGLPDEAPAGDANGGTGRVLPRVVELDALEGMAFADVGGYSAADSRSAFEFAAAFAAERYRSGLWVTSSIPVAGRPAVYYRYGDWLSKAAASRFEGMVIDAAAVKENQAALDALLPPAPPIGDGVWLVPAVANWTFGQPVFSVEGSLLTVAFEAAGVGIYQDKDGVYWSVVVRDRVAYALMRENGAWRVDSWASERAVEEPQAMKDAPVGRYRQQPPVEEPAPDVSMSGTVPGNGG